MNSTRMDSRMDFSQIKARENPQPFPPGQRIAVKEEDMRYLYGVLMAEGPRVSSDSSLNDGVLLEIQRGFEMTRHGLEINGEVIRDGVRFRETCESTSGIDPVDTGLQDQISNLYAEMDSVLMTLMKLRHEVPQKALKRYARTLKPEPELPELPLETPETEVSPSFEECKRSLAQLPELEDESRALKKKTKALMYL